MDSPPLPVPVGSPPAGRGGSAGGGGGDACVRRRRCSQRATFPTPAAPVGRHTLGHEVLDHTVEDGTIVVPLHAQLPPRGRAESGGGERHGGTQSDGSGVSRRRWALSAAAAGARLLRMQALVRRSAHRHLSQPAHSLPIAPPTCHTAPPPIQTGIPRLCTCTKLRTALGASLGQSSTSRSPSVVRSTTCGKRNARGGRSARGAASTAAAWLQQRAAAKAPRSFAPCPWWEAPARRPVTWLQGPLLTQGPLQMRRILRKLRRHG